MGVDCLRGKPGPWAELYSTARWQRIRRHQLQEHPLCKYCAETGIVKPATICDHVEPHHGDVYKFWSGPFQSLCKRCHDSASAQLRILPDCRFAAHRPRGHRSRHRRPPPHSGQALRSRPPTGSPSAAALQQATRTVPIVFVTVVDPVGSGFVDSAADFEAG